MIESIQIKNFRGIQTGQIDGFRKFNLLVGPNNSGKSSVLEALYLAATADRKARIILVPAGATYDGRVSDNDLLGNHPMARVLDRHNYVEPSLNGAPRGGLHVHISSSSAPLQDFQLSFGPLSNQSVLEQADNIAIFGFEAGDQAPVPDREEQKKRKQQVLAFAAQLLRGEVGDFKDQRLVYCWLTSLTYYRSGSAVWVVKGRMAPARHTLLYDVSMTLGHLPMDFFRRMIETIPGWSQKIAQGFCRILGVDHVLNAQFFPVDQSQQWTQGLIAPEDRIALTIDSYGDGARSIFKVLTPLIALSELASEDAPGLFIWEEPEMFQNPQTLNRLLAEIALLLRDKPVQVFLATHSLEVVANFVRQVREGQIDEDEMAAIRLNLGDGQLSSSVFDHRDIQDWTEMNLDLRVPSGKVDSPLTYQLRETVNATSHD
jgi:energy-coupling factor transporter ATP-binding protein EcfA2